MTTSDNWEPGLPTKHINDVIESHRTRSRGQRVADNIETTLDLPYVPDFLRDFVSTGVSGLGYKTDDYISIDKRNFETRVNSGEHIIATFGSFASSDQQQLVAEAVVVEASDSKQGDIIITVNGEEVQIKGWQVKGVLREDSKEKAQKRQERK